MLGGAILGPRSTSTGRSQTLMRHTGPSMSPFNAWVLLKGLETLSLRVDHRGAVARCGSRAGSRISRGCRSVRYPYLPSHPQYDLARRQMSGGRHRRHLRASTAARREAFGVLDALRIIDISNNLGDAKSIVTHPATTTHRRLAAQARAAAGITDGVVRVPSGSRTRPT